MTLTECQIEWNKISKKDWDDAYSRIRRAPLLQSWLYGECAAAAENLKPRRGCIMIGGKMAGLVQIMENRFFGGALHALSLDNGPLFFETFDNAKSHEAFFKCFNNEFPPRPGRRRRILPNIQDTKANRAIMQNGGFRQTKSAPHQTIWLDLRPDLETLRAGLKQKWRNILNKAGRSDLDIEIAYGARAIKDFCAAYDNDKKQKGYGGPNPAYLNRLLTRFSRHDHALILNAKGALAERPAAAIVLLCHGYSATYLAGWTHDEGRQKGAHHLLLWHAVKTLKDKQYLDFDLGGINETSASNIKKFKEGLSSDIYRYAGFYR